MKIFLIQDGKAHWLTPYRSMDELYSDVPQGKGKTERQLRYPESDVFVEAPDEVQEGWIYLGGGKFRSDEPERLQEEIDKIDGQLRDMHKESLFQDWLKSQIAKCAPFVAETDTDMMAWSAAYDSVISGFDDEAGVVSNAVLTLVKKKNELERKLKDFETEIVSL